MYKVNNKNFNFFCVILLILLISVTENCFSTDFFNFESRNELRQRNINPTTSSKVVIQNSTHLEEFGEFEEDDEELKLIKDFQRLDFINYSRSSLQKFLKHLKKDRTYREISEKTKILNHSTICKITLYDSYGVNENYKFLWDKLKEVYPYEYKIFCETNLGISIKRN